MAGGPNESTTTLDVNDRVPEIANSFLDQLAAEAEASVRRGPDLTDAQNPNATVTNEAAVPENESSLPSQLPPEALPPPPVGLPQVPAPPPPAETQSAPSAAESPVEVPPIAAAPVAAAPAAAEQTPAERLAYKLAREAERKERATMEELQQNRLRLQQLEMERAAERVAYQRQQTPAIEAPETYEQDPLTQMQQQMAQLQQQLQVQQLETEITTQVNTFTQQHPDFDKAMNHYVESEIQLAEEDGTLAEMASRIRGLQNGNEMIRNVAMQQGTTEADAARTLAIATIYQQRRQQLALAAKRSGKNIGELVYSRAQRYGYTPQTAQPADAQLPETASAAAHVRQEQTAAATASLANIPRQNATPRAREYTRADLEVLMKTDPNAANNYIAEMDAKDPNWLHHLG